MAQQYDVVQTREEVARRVFDAIQNKNEVILDMIGSEGPVTVRFRVRTTDHGDDGSLVIGYTDDGTIVNIHTNRDDGVIAVME